MVQGFKAINTPDNVKKVRPSHTTVRELSLTLGLRPGHCAKLGGGNLSYESLTSPETRQALVGLRDANFALYEQLSTPLPSAPIPPPPPGTTNTYPEDQEHEEDLEMPVDSSLSINDVVVWIADEAPRDLVDFSGDEDEGVDGFSYKDSDGPRRVLEPFNPQLATSYWPKLDGDATSM